LDRRGFNDSLNESLPPAGIAPALVALWWAKKGDWEKAHRLVMEEASAEAAWVHAYLHRVEGDESNASYWYAKAGRSVARGNLDAEWEAIIATLLARG
jgi:hypothetical protein